MKRFLLGAAFSGLMLSAMPALAATVTVQGNVYAAPCTLDPNDTDITLDFGTIIDTYLYENTRTHSQPFTIHLNCDDLDDWGGDGTVKVRFEGTADSELTGFLAMTDTSTGAAIGIEDTDGSFLGLDKDSTPVPLSSGGVALNFKAFVQGEPSALTNRKLKLGNFSATSTFYLNYP